MARPPGPSSVDLLLGDKMRPLPDHRRHARTRAASLALLLPLALAAIACRSEEREPAPPAGATAVDALPPAIVYRDAEVPPERRTVIEQPAGHRWLYGRQTMSYQCLEHGHSFDRQKGKWVAIDGPPSSPIVEPVEILFNGPRPYLHVETHRRPRGASASPVLGYRVSSGHRWAYYTRSDVYYCAVHRHSIRREGDRWYAVDRSGEEPKGPSIVVHYNGPDPHFFVEEHRRRR